MGRPTESMGLCVVVDLGIRGATMSAESVGLCVAVVVDLGIRGGTNVIVHCMVAEIINSTIII